MMARADITDLMAKLRYAHNSVKHYRARARDPLNPMARYDREEWNYHECRCDAIIEELNQMTRTGISKPFTPGADRDAEIEAFLGPVTVQIAAE